MPLTAGAQSILVTISNHNHSSHGELTTQPQSLALNYNLGQKTIVKVCIWPQTEIETFYN